MPFIGKQPQVGAYSKLDAITASATATYNLALNSGAYYPSSANHLMVSLNGVIQAPQDSFTISGRTIIFDSALTSNDSIDFIMALGDVLDIGTPSDGTVVTAKIQNAAVTTAKLASSLDLSGKTVTMPAGAVLQVKSTFVATTFSSTATNFTDMGLAVTITPTSTSSKILVSYNLGTVDTAADTRVGFRIVRGSTAVGVGATAGSRYLASTAATTVTQRGQPHSFQFLDSPARTSATTYKVQQYNQGSTLTLGIRTGNDGDGASVYRTGYNIIVQEIAG